MPARVTRSPTERSWKLRGGHTEVDLRGGTIEKMLGVCRSLRARMLQSRESREPQDLELATGLAVKLRQTFNIVLGLPLGQLPPAQFSAILDGGQLPPTAWTIEYCAGKNRVVHVGTQAPRPAATSHRPGTLST